MNTCTIEGCKRTIRTKQMCATHYNQTQPGRHKKTAVACAACGKQVERWGGGGKGYSRRPVCSYACRYYLTWGHWPPSDAERAEVEAQRLRRAEARAALRSAAAERRAHAFRPHERECAWCGSTFTASMPHQVMCHLGCKTRAKVTRRRAREAGASGTYTWSEVTRVYLDIGSVCAYCHQPTPDFQPDHVIPLSRGGSNSITNIVPSCNRCNGDKRDLPLSEWYADRERRGLEPRSLHPGIKHLTSALLVA
jgi:endogenous inhibitor of DNA gyrase (YacG/DUF329 family)